MIKDIKGFPCICVTIQQPAFVRFSAGIKDKENLKYSLSQKG